MSCCCADKCGWCSNMCSYVTWVLRILLGAAWIYFGVSKFGADADKMEFIGSAATGLFPFLDFLSTSVWFWVAAITQIVMGLVLLAGCRFLVKYAAVMSLIMLMFITHTAWWWLNIDPTATWILMYVPVILAALGTVVVLKGAGAFVLCPMSSCRWGSCDAWSCSTKSSENDENIIVVE